MSLNRPVWAEIDLGHIVHNYLEVRRLVGSDVQVMAIVKANAYGHGAVEVARALDEAGAERFGVAILNEALQLRKSAVNKPIMVIGWTPPDDYVRALQDEIILTIFSLQEAEILSKISLQMGKKARVHLKVDSGMSRIGFLPGNQSAEQIRRILDFPGLEVEGVFTHLAKADERDKTYTMLQLQRFRNFVAGIEEKCGFRFRIKHAANSAAIIDHPEAYLDMVRPGIILYGLKPSEEVALARINLKPALSLRARVAFVKELPAGVSVSYGGKFVTSLPSTIATIPIGYADGYSRLLSGRAEVLCQGKRLPAVGRICMDQFMVDATSLSCRPEQGDVVTLMGRDGDNFISIDELAGILGTINYEVACMLSGRVPRVYLSPGR